MQSARIFTTCIAALLLAVGTQARAQSDLGQPPIKVLAAGSLTGAMTAVAKVYTGKTGQRIDAQFGPAGLLRERIEAGEQTDLFVSANMAHPQALADRGIASQPVVMLRNSLCAKALPEFGLTTANVLDRLLDPRVGLGTSTPKADPGGDYTWMMFARAEKVQPGAQAILEAKAQQLVGGKDNPPVPAGRSAMEYFFAEKRVQMTVGYCSGRQTKPDPNFVSVPLPPELAITPSYGLSVMTRGKQSHEAAYRFALYLMSPEAQAIMAQYGFIPVGIPAEN